MVKIIKIAKGISYQEVIYTYKGSKSSLTFLNTERINAKIIEENHLNINAA